MLNGIPAIQNSAMQNSAGAVAEKQSVIAEQIHRARQLRGQLTETIIVLENKIAPVLRETAEATQGKGPSAPTPNKLRSILEEGNDELAGLVQALQEISSRIEL